VPGDAVVDEAARGRDIRSGSEASKPLMTNAVIEKVKTTGAATFKKRRCLLPVSGFWEWTGEKGDKQAWAIERCDGAPIVMAGVWDMGRHEGVNRDSVAVITMPASPWISAIHNRMPAMLPANAWRAYLDSAVDDLAPMTERVDEKIFRAFKVGKHVNKVGNDGPECLQPLAA
jgi:putative SOS response-associated peptidase YedK